MGLRGLPADIRTGACFNGRIDCSSRVSRTRVAHRGLRRIRGGLDRQPAPRVRRGQAKEKIRWRHRPQWSDQPMALRMSRVRSLRARRDRAPRGRGRLTGSWLGDSRRDVPRRTTHPRTLAPAASIRCSTSRQRNERRAFAQQRFHQRPVDCMGRNKPRTELNEIDVIPHTPSQSNRPDQATSGSALNASGQVPESV